MPLMAPESRESTATRRKGARNQVGRIVARAPTGSRAMASDRSCDEPASSKPMVMRTTGPSDPPTVFHSTMELPEASRLWYRDQSAAMLIQPSPMPVMTIVMAPIPACHGPSGRCVTTPQSMCGIVMVT